MIIKDTQTLQTILNIIIYNFFLFFTEEKKVKKYLEDNYQHRTDLISPDPDIKTSEQNGVLTENPKKIQGVGPKTKEGMYYKNLVDIRLA